MMKKDHQKSTTIKSRHSLSRPGKVQRETHQNCAFSLSFFRILNVRGFWGPFALFERSKPHFVKDLSWRNFLWDGNSDRRELHLMCWNEVIQPEHAGGLGLGNLDVKNWALLAKRWWRYGAEKEALWRKVIVSNYGEDEWGWV